MKAFILSGGFGSKLREVVYNQPKILATIKGKAFLDHLFYLLKKNGFSEVVLGLGYLSGMVKDYVIQRPLYDMSVMFSVEPRPLGTAGALKNGEKFLDTTFFVVNGDTYLDTDYQKILEYHRQNKALITMVSAKNVYADGFGKVTASDSGHVEAFVTEKSEKTGDYAHAGIYVMEPAVLSLIPQGYNSSIEKDILPELIKQGNVFEYKCQEPFIDIGDAQGYILAQTKLER